MVKLFQFRPQGAHGIPKAEDRKKWQDEKNAATGVFYRMMIEHVKKVLADPKRVCPEYDEKAGYELAGFVWLQGFNDLVDGTTYPGPNQPGKYDLYSDLLTPDVNGNLGFLMGGTNAAFSGFQLVYPAGVVNSGFTTWAAANVGGQTAGEDFDNDGVENGIEYFMGQTGSSFTAMPGLDGTNTVTWTMNPAYAGTYEVQTSPDLSTWTNVDPRPAPSGGNLSYTLTSGLGKQFVRLLVTPTP